MTKMRFLAAAFMLAIGLTVFQPIFVWAAEHGGATVGASKEHGGATHDEADEASLLRKAAAALRKGEARPDLAARLEKLAKEEAAKKN